MSDFEIIVGISSLLQVIILNIQNMLEVLLEYIGITKGESIYLHIMIMFTSSSILYVIIHYPIALSILGILLPLYVIAVP